jgi:hypothetical protein
MSPDMTDLKALIARVATGARLSEAEAELAFDIIMSGNATPSQMGGFLMALRVRGETVEEITKAPPGTIDTAAPAVTIPAPSISRPQPHWSWRPAACRSQNTAIARRPASRVRPMCLRPSASISIAKWPWFSGRWMKSASAS